MQDITDVIAESLPSCASVLVDTKVFLHNYNVHVHVMTCNRRNTPYVVNHDDVKEAIMHAQTLVFACTYCIYSS